MANFCGVYLGELDGRESVLGDFDVFFGRVRSKLLPFFCFDLCFPSVCEGHGAKVSVFMDWVGGFWLLHEPIDESSPADLPKPLKIPDSDPLTKDQLDDLAELRGYSAEETRKCVDPELYAALVALGVPPQPPAKVATA